MLAVVVLQHPGQMPRRSLQHALIPEESSSFRQPASEMGAVGGHKVLVEELAPGARGILNFAKPVAGTLERRAATLVLSSLRPALQAVHNLRGVKRGQVVRVLGNLGAGKSAAGKLHR